MNKTEYLISRVKEALGKTHFCAPTRETTKAEINFGNGEDADLFVSFVNRVNAADTLADYGK